MLIRNGSRLLLNATGEIWRKIRHYRYFRKSPIFASKSLKVAILGCTGRTGNKIVMNKIYLFEIRSPKYGYFGFIRI